jgi:hypothetical protein
MKNKTPVVTEVSKNVKHAVNNGEMSLNQARIKFGLCPIPDANAPLKKA